MSVSAILRCCPILTKEHMLDIDAVGHHEVFRSGSLTPVRCGVDERGVDRFKEIHICVNHEKDNVIGVVTDLREDVGISASGRWLYAHARIDTPPAWLSKDTNVSISYKELRRRSPFPGQEWSIVDQGWLTEISLLAPGQKPAHPAARVMWFGESESSAAVSTSDRAVAGEVIQPLRPQLIRRFNCGDVLAVNGVPVRS